MNSLELLAPAKNLSVGICAINHGADAVYIGAQTFGARQMAGNSLADIETLVQYAHRYHAKVYLTLNTILFDHELEQAQKLAHDAYLLGVDALIVQDMAWLNMDLPPIAIHASTQMNNVDVEKIKQYQSWGINRVVLARELSLTDIATIAKQTSIEIESFVHGALCVCYSGQCYLSQHIGGRSANRGACAQPCRLAYQLKDGQGNLFGDPKHYLSLKDMNRIDYLYQMATAGVTSFKIEGRLKDENYVANVVGAYRMELDKLIEHNELFQSASLGKVTLGFQPDLERTFNRGYTAYFIEGKRELMANFLTPKSIGKPLGKVEKLQADAFRIDTQELLSKGDGLCWVGNKGLLQGMNVFDVNQNWIRRLKEDGLEIGTMVYRNCDHHFLSLLKNEKTQRKIPVTLRFTREGEAFVLQVLLQNDLLAQVSVLANIEMAKNPELALKNIENQLKKSGDSIFSVQKLLLDLGQAYFFQTSTLNALRRDAFEIAEQSLLQKHQKPVPFSKEITVLQTQTTIDYRANVSNRLAKDFYRQLGLDVSEPAFELLKNTREKAIFVSKYCLAYQLGACRKENGSQQLPADLLLSYAGNNLKVVFDCKNCRMLLFAQ